LVILFAYVGHSSGVEDGRKEVQTEAVELGLADFKAEGHNQTTFKWRK